MPIQRPLGLKKWIAEHFRNSLILDKEKFLARYSGIAELNVDYCFDMFDEAIQTKNSEMVEEAMLLTDFLKLFSAKFSSLLCKLLQEDWHYKHEDIAMILKEIKDSSTVDCLFNAAQLNFDYLAYDDTYQFARKCIKAISEINNDEAIEKLIILAKTDKMEIREYAIKELRYKGLAN